MAKHIRTAHYLLLSLLSAGLSSCEDYLGKKTNLDFIDVPTYEVREISYVPVAPTLYDALAPVDICIGYDEFIYVVDSAQEAILRFDLALTYQGAILVPGVTKVVQDRRLRLLAIGTHDTTIAGVDRTLAALYQIDLVENGLLSFDGKQPKKVLTHPYYFKNSFSSTDATVRFTDVAVMGSLVQSENNSYYLSRTGSSSNNAGFGPDNAVLKFDKNHQFISSLPVTASGATYNNYFKRPMALAAFTQPPQFTANNSPDFWVSNVSEDQEIQVQHIQFTEGPFGALYEPIFYPTTDPSATGFLQLPKRFVNPADLCLAGDGSRFLFVADAGVDSVYQFTSQGMEGVPPPPASNSEKNAIVTLGGYQDLRAIAYYDRILYVADAAAGAIFRYKLTLDFD